MIMIIGSNGFLGSNLMAHLGQAGYQCIGIQRQSRSTLKNHLGVGDFMEADWHQVLCQYAPSDVVFCAGSSSVQASFDDPSADRLANVSALERLLIALIQLRRRPRLLFLSSAAVYGQPDQLPISETQLKGPISPYGKHKDEAEQMCGLFENEYGLPVDVVRPFSIYGPGLRQRVFWDVGQRLLTAGMARARGSGTERRDFMFSDDFCRALVTVMMRPRLDDEPGSVFNVASGESVSLHQALGALCNALDLDASAISFDGVPQAGVPTAWSADITRIRGLGFEPQVSIDEGIGHYADFLLKQKPSLANSNE